jgi:hypothetical protein
LVRVFSFSSFPFSELTDLLSPPVAPDAGVDEDIAHLYFKQLIAGLVRFFRTLLSSPSSLPFSSFDHPSQSISAFFPLGLDLKLIV